MKDKKSKRRDNEEDGGAKEAKPTPRPPSSHQPAANADPWSAALGGTDGGGAFGGAGDESYPSLPRAMTNERAAKKRRRRELASFGDDALDAPVPARALVLLRGPQAPVAAAAAAAAPAGDGGDHARGQPEKKQQQQQQQQQQKPKKRAKEEEEEDDDKEEKKAPGGGDGNGTTGREDDDEAARRRKERKERRKQAKKQKRAAAAAAAEAAAAAAAAGGGAPAPAAADAPENKKKKKSKNKFKQQQQQQQEEEPGAPAAAAAPAPAPPPPPPAPPAPKTATTPTTPTTSRLLDKMRARLAGGQFRQLNEALYTRGGAEALALMAGDPSLFSAYHSGFQEQTRAWPAQPADLAAEWAARALPRGAALADFGCGDARLSRALAARRGQDVKVHSLDLVAASPGVIACNMAETPLETASCDAAVFSLALMGTDYGAFLGEARRVLRSPPPLGKAGSAAAAPPHQQQTTGLLWIAEVRSRFVPEGADREDFGPFLKCLRKLGFRLQRQDASNRMFVVWELRLLRPDEHEGKNKGKGEAGGGGGGGAAMSGEEAKRLAARLEWPPLRACVYKKR